MEVSGDECRYGDRGDAGNGNVAGSVECGGTETRCRLVGAEVWYGESPSVPITDIVNLVRSSERAEMIEKYVLDRPDQAN